jgi:hypothetical protein
MLGLWESSLAASALWSVGESSVRHRNTHSGAPSWSWGSVTGVVDYDIVGSIFRPPDDVQSLCTELRTRVAIDCLGPIVPVRAASHVLEVSGHVLPVTLQYFQSTEPNLADRHWCFGVKPARKDNETEDSKMTVGRLIQFRADYQLQSPGESEVKEGSLLHCLRFALARSAPFFMILRQVDQSRGIFKRIGLLCDPLLWKRDGIWDYQPWVSLPKKYRGPDWLGLVERTRETKLFII